MIELPNHPMHKHQLNTSDEFNGANRMLVDWLGRKVNKCYDRWITDTPYGPTKMLCSLPYHHRGDHYDADFSRHWH